jgi:hypothetical protein
VLSRSRHPQFQLAYNSEEITNSPHSFSFSQMLARIWLFMSRLFMSRIQSFIQKYLGVPDYRTHQVCFNGPHLRLRDQTCHLIARPNSDHAPTKVRPNPLVWKASDGRAIQLRGRSEFTSYTVLRYGIL